ncbi:MAG: DNA-processing protein DprA [Cytophagaceae bacterium]|nr:DNA-processing protein DprA [Cytophagaceae bacterium]
MNNLLYEVAIGLIPGIGSSYTRQLVSYCGSAEAVFKESKGKLKKIPGIGEILAETIINNDVLQIAEREILLASKSDTTILFYTHKNFPERLKHIPDAPTLLYYKGNVDLNAKKILGIVGTRKATSYGKEIVEKILSDLIPQDILIVSGLAYGIDITAHKAALANRQPTIGVMASGIDIIYPAMHKQVAMDMTENGGLITEYPFGTKPDAPHFPSRNRIIAGLCDAIIVAEAAESGGALITAEIANGYDREVFAVPGNIGSKYSEGCNKLIRGHKAHIFTCVKDLDYIMNWSATENKVKTPAPPDLTQFSPEEKTVLQTMEGTQGMLIDELSWKSQIPVNKLASILLNLEFQGVVKSLPGKKFKII